MIILPSQTIHMHRDARMQRKALQTMRQHLTAQVPNLLALRAQVDDRKRPIREVDDRARERFVERAVGGAEAREARGGVQGGFEGLFSLWSS